jgi:DNA (cytosine-5)-methyltransferase 1
LQHRFFIDLFAGCGGLSLGLAQAGWKGLFAIERDPMAFRTFADNLVATESGMQFSWPSWLECRSWPIDKFLNEHRSDLRRLRNKVALIAGGPPCQGFSVAGRRDRLDPRNLLFKKYVEVIDAVRPNLLIVENVPGMSFVHGTTQNQRVHKRPGRPIKPYSERLIGALEKLGYHVEGQVRESSGYGVPQKRSRYVVIGIRRDFAPSKECAFARLEDLIERHRLQQLTELDLKIPVTASDALADLETRYTQLRPCTDPESRKGFMEPVYRGPRSRYQRLMNDAIPPESMTSLRLARHTSPVSARFARILRECEPGRPMHERDRARFGLRKQRIHPLAAKAPAPTVTTLPDDLLHYAEPRILTVREYARLQSFPDWFVFRGKYTTGGKRRVRECPRYTQIGNAVPPLFARALGKALAQFARETEAQIPEVHDRAIA